MTLNLSTNEIRNKDLSVSDSELVEELLRRARTGYLGLSDSSGPYVVPLNYVWYNSSIYVHGAKQGRKSEIMKKSPEATFVISEEYGTIADPVPARTDTAYLSVMLFGRVSPVPDANEATLALDLLLSKYVPGYYSRRLEKEHVLRYVSNQGSRAEVYKLTAERVTAKYNEAVESALFYAGKTQLKDLMNQVGKA